MLMLDKTANLFTKEDAEKLAKEMNESDDWVYTVVNCPNGTGFSFINIHDEEGKFISKF